MAAFRSAMLALVVLTGYSACAQQFTLPDAPSQHKFFDRQNKIAFGTLAALVAVDAVTTQRLTNSGSAHEANPLWRPMVNQGLAGRNGGVGTRLQRGGGGCLHIAQDRPPQTGTVGKLASRRDGRGGRQPQPLPRRSTLGTNGSSGPGVSPTSYCETRRPLPYNCWQCSNIQS